MKNYADKKKPKRGGYYRNFRICYLPLRIYYQQWFCFRLLQLLKLLSLFSHFHKGLNIFNKNFFKSSLIYFAGSVSAYGPLFQDSLLRRNTLPRNSLPKIVLVISQIKTILIENVLSQTNKLPVKLSAHQKWMIHW